VNSPFYNFISYIFISLNIILGLVVIFRNKKSKMNIVFFVVDCFIIITLLSNYLVDFTHSAASALMWTRITNFAALWVMFFLLYFALIFPKTLKKGYIKLIKYFLFVPVFLSFVTFSPLLISGMESKDWGFNPILGPFVSLHFAYLIIAFLLLFGVLILQYKSSRSLEKSQIKYIFLGFGLLIIFALIFSAIIPLVTNSGQTAKLAPIATSFFIAFTSYAIVKHRLMDIRLVVARSIAYSVLVLIVAGVYAGSVLALERIFFPGTSQLGLAQGALRTVLAVIIAFTFQPLRKAVTKATDSIFFKEQYDPEAFLKETNKILSTNIILTELLYKTLDHIIQEMRILEGTFVVVEDDKIHTIQSIGYKSAPDIKFEDVKKLSRIDIIVFDELEEGSHLKNILRKYEASVVIRLMEDHQFAGLLMLGEKKSGDMFAAKDIEILEITAPEITMAMQRAKQYEEIQKFNLTLRAEVMRKTKKLREANEHLQELDKAKDEFISMASHQLRTPLTAIKGYLSMLLEGDAGEIKIGQYDFINEAFQGANKMVNLINDLLNVSRMSTGKFFIDPMPLDMKKLIQEEMKQLTTAARQKGIFLKFEAPADMPKIEADENKIRQVIMNFIDNSVYYTEKGGVTVKCSASHKDFVFEVRDTGIGVPKEMQQKLFAKFYRADNARRLRPDGTGLGLYLAKRVIEDHKGELIFRSTPGKGSVFGFRLPIHSPIKVDPKKHELLNLH